MTMSTSAAAAPSAPGVVGIAGQRDDVVGAEVGQRGQAVGIAAGADDAAGAEALGDLDGHLPALPVAPSTSTLWPGWKATRRRSATQEDIAGFIAAAIVTGSASGGQLDARRRSTTACSAIVPSVRVGEDEVDAGAVGGAARRRRCRGPSAGRPVLV